MCAKVMMLSDSTTTVTGFATITKNILNGLTDEGHECHQLAHNLYSQMLKPPITFEDDTQIRFYMHGCGREAYCKDIIMPKIQKYKPDVFGVLLDTFMVYPWFVDLDFAPARSFFYFPSDGGGGLPNFCENILRKVEIPVAMSRFAQRQVKQIHNIDSAYIPHAVDHTIYYNKNKEECKARFNLKGKFVVGTVARNQGRKMMDRTLKAFALFAKTHPDAVLLMHSDPTDPASVFHLGILINRLNIENKVFFTGMKFHDGFDYRDMVNVYNAMDVFLLTTSGEGFGVPIIEAMACQIPCIVTDYTTTHELLIEDGQCGLKANLAGVEEIDYALSEKDQDWETMNGTITGSWTVERALMDIKDGAKKLDILYSNPEMRERFGIVGREKVLKEYSWAVNIPRWNEIIKKLSQ